jgi:GTPase SAR1 family protein
MAQLSSSKVLSGNATNINAENDRLELNLWASLLRESSKRSHYYPDSKVFLFGESQAGKSSLLQKISSNYSSNPSVRNSNSSFNNNDDSNSEVSANIDLSFTTTSEIFTPEIVEQFDWP